jgi:hypothetical protein
MGKGLGITLAMLCLIYVPASLFAQNAPLNLNYQSGLLLEKITLFQHDGLNPQTSNLAPVGLIIQTPAIGYGGLIAPLNRPIYSLMKNKDLIYTYWQDVKVKAAKNKKLNAAVDRNVFNALYNKPRVDEKKRIRLAWKKVFGVDVWYPYYKVKEIEDWVKEKMSVRAFGFKGKPKFENDQIVYTFRKTF